MKSYLTEFIGTFFLVLTICLAVASGSALAPVAIGAILMVMVYMGGHISGAHYNPAVTASLFVRGKTSPAILVPYVIAQVAGAFAAAALGFLLTGQTLDVEPGKDVNILHALIVEVAFTFALALVVLNVATVPRTANNSYYGLAIGFTVTAAAVAGGGISGGAFNPAVGTGPALWKAIVEQGAGLQHLWLYWVGPVAGGILAAIVFKVQNPEREAA